MFKRMKCEIVSIGDRAILLTSKFVRKAVRGKNYLNVTDMMLSS